MTSCFKIVRRSFHDRFFRYQVTNFLTVLLRSIKALNMFDQWMGGMQNLSATSSFKITRRSLFTTSKNPSLDCNFLFFLSPVNFWFHLIVVIAIPFFPRQYTIFFEWGSVNSNKVLNNFIIPNPFYDHFWLVSM